MCIRDSATTARLFAKAIGVFLTKSEGILIVGASEVSRLIARYLQKNGRHVVLVDSNMLNIQAARELELNAIEGNIYSDDLISDVELSDVGYLMALTGNLDINNFALGRFKKQFGENGSFRLITKQEMEEEAKIPKEGLFSTTDDFMSLTEVARRYPAIQEVSINSQEEYDEVMKRLMVEPDMIPLFVKRKDGMIDIIGSVAQNIYLKSFDMCTLAYLGKPMRAEDA